MSNLWNSLEKVIEYNIILQSGETIMGTKTLSVKVVMRVIVGSVLILSGIGSLFLYVTFRGKAESWLNSIGIFSLFGMGVGLIALGIGQIMSILSKPHNGQNKD